MAAYKGLLGGSIGTFKVTVTEMKLKLAQYWSKGQYWFQARLDPRGSDNHQNCLHLLALHFCQLCCHGMAG